MRIKINYVKSYASKILTPCIYHLADGTHYAYWQTGKGELQ